MSCFAASESPGNGQAPDFEPSGLYRDFYLVFPKTDPTSNNRNFLYPQSWNEFGAVLESSGSEVYGWNPGDALFRV